MAAGEPGSSSYFEAIRLDARREELHTRLTHLHLDHQAAQQACALAIDSETRAHTRPTRPTRAPSGPRTVLHVDGSGNTTPLTEDQHRINTRLRPAVTDQNIPSIRALFQANLDLLGMVPVLGEFADFVNGQIHQAHGEHAAAALSYAATVPGPTGLAATLTKLGLKHTPETAKTAKAAATAPSSRIVPGGGLKAHETAPGAHTLKKHVDVTDDDLRARLAREPRRAAASRFTDRAAAERAVSEALQANRQAIDDWLSRGAPIGEGPFTHLLGESAGVTLKRGAAEPEAVFGVKIVLRASPDFPDGYRVHTAFPIPEKK